MELLMEMMGELHFVVFHFVVCVNSGVPKY